MNEEDYAAKISQKNAEKHIEATTQKHPGWGGARVAGAGKTMGRPKSPPRQDGRKLYPVYTWLTPAEWEAIRDGSSGDGRRPPLLKLVGFQVDNNQP